MGDEEVRLYGSKASSRCPVASGFTFFPLVRDTHEIEQLNGSILYASLFFFVNGSLLCSQHDLCSVYCLQAGNKCNAAALEKTALRLRCRKKQLSNLMHLPSEDWACKFCLHLHSSVFKLLRSCFHGQGGGFFAT